MDIILCDDHPVVRVGLIHIIQAGLPGSTVREAGDGRELLTLVRERTPDVVVLDVGLPGRGGLDVLLQLKHEQPRLAVLILSMHSAQKYAVRALRSGASGYLEKASVAEELVGSLRTVASGRKYLTPQVAERLAAELDRESSHLPHEALSVREYEILTLLASGRSVRQIADEFCLSYSTISTYRARIGRKLQVKNTAELIRYAIVNDLVD